MKQNVTYNDLIKRLDDLDKNITKRLDDFENRNSVLSFIFLLFSIAIAFVIYYLSTKEIIHLCIGIICYIFGFIISYKHKIKF